MSLLDILLHLLNFSAPALVLALLLPLVSRFFIKKQVPALAWWAQAAINFIVGVAALLVGLWLWRRDGKMAAYALLVLALATCQWLLSRGWRR